jgi:hypothetical protein
MTTTHDFLIKIVPKLILLAGFILCLTSLVWYGIILISLSIGFLFRHHITWAPEVEIIEEPVEVQPEVFPKPAQYIIGVVIDDSTSGRQYQIKSMNEFGLTWYIDQHNCIYIRQKMDDNPSDRLGYRNWKAMGFFPHHAITEVRWSKLEKLA